MLCSDSEHEEVAFFAIALADVCTAMDRSQDLLGSTLRLRGKRVHKSAVAARLTLSPVSVEGAEQLRPNFKRPRSRALPKFALFPEMS